jgi:hypothetical protein
MTQPKQGIVIIAGGLTYYGQQGANLCASIRRHDKEIGIVIYVTPSSMRTDMSNQLKSKLNVDVRLLPEECYIDSKGKENYLMAKTHIYKLSPFDQTLFLDADTLWLPMKSPSNFINEFGELKFTMCNEGYIDTATGEDNTTGIYTTWTDYADVVKKYGSRLGAKFYLNRSEFIYFRKCKEVREMFATSIKIYQKPLVSAMHLGGSMADEIAFNIACSIHNLYPHKDRWTPAYWPYRQMKVHHSYINTFDIPYKYRLISLGGNNTVDSILRYYNQQSKSNFAAMGLHSYAEMINKAVAIPARREL